MARSALESVSEAIFSTINVSSVTSPDTLRSVTLSVPTFPDVAFNWYVLTRSELTIVEFVVPAFTV